MTTKAQVKQIREIIKKHYDYWSTYNDVRKNGTRRIKCMTNGEQHPQEFWDKKEKAILADLNASNIPFISAGFQDGERYGYGDYKYFAVVVTHE